MKKKHNMATKANDSTTVMKLHTTVSTIERSKYMWAQLVLRPVKSNSGHRKIDDGLIQSGKSNSGNRKIEEDQLLPIYFFVLFY
ncbi:hypothetical protein MRB53_031976 [Persea americana]|uniref:Uncharacterized protein n=1 Tax=Persea americana TaxID=3435 RepID=A0ACC2KRN5_PERAE|nr:hypothetical protein MRB53_031976 [Persea americana]